MKCSRTLTLGFSGIEFDIVEETLHSVGGRRLVGRADAAHPGVRHLPETRYRLITCSLHRNYSLTLVISKFTLCNCCRYKFNVTAAVQCNSIERKGQFIAIIINNS